QSFQPAPAGAHAPYGGYGSPCGRLMKSKPVQVVYGPGTFLNRAVAAVNLQTQALLKSAQQAVSSAQQAAYQLAIGRHMSRAQAISWIRQAVKMPMFHLSYGGTYTVSGVPVVINDLASRITSSIAGMLVAAVLVMAATLMLVFRRRLRLLPLAIALMVVGITF